MSKAFFAVVVGLMVAMIIAILLSPGENANGKWDAFAKCITDRGATMYGSPSCAHCLNEKRAFGDSFRYIQYVDCSVDPEKCIAAKIDGYPTWIFGDGRRFEGEQGLKKLSEESGCPLIEAK